MPSAFEHGPSITVPASNTTANAAAIWSAASNLGESTIILDSGGNGRIGIAGDLDTITITSGTVTVAGTVAATTLTGTGAGITALAAANITASGTLPALSGVNLTALVAGNITAGGTFLAQDGSALTALNGTQITSGTVPVAQLGSSGTRSSSTFLNGANAWAAAGGIDGTGAAASIAYWSDTDTLTQNATLTWHSGNHALRMSRAGNIQFDMVPTGGTSQAWAISARTDGTFRITNDSDGSIDLKIDGNGAITQARQPAFIAKLTTQQTNVTGNTILFKSESYANSQWSIIENRGSGFANGKFTAPVTGVYQFNVSIYLNHLNSSNTYFNLSLFTDGPGGTISISSSNAWAQAYTTSGNLFVRWSQLVELDANDYAYFGGYLYYGSQVVDLEAGTYWSAYLVA
jgi:hypothetical protein